MADWLFVSVSIKATLILELQVSHAKKTDQETLINTAAHNAKHFHGNGLGLFQKLELIIDETICCISWLKISLWNICERFWMFD
jgi:hypothetical protein